MGVPGVWDEGGWLGGCLGGLYRYPPDQSQDPYIHIFKAKGPTHGQMKAFLDYSMRFLRLGPDRVLE